MSRRNIVFGLFFVLAFLMAYAPIKALLDSSSQREYYSHIALIPLISSCLIFQIRKLVWGVRDSAYGSRAKLQLNDRVAGTLLLLAGVLLYFFGRRIDGGLNQNDITSIATFAALVFLNGGFIFSYGLLAFHAALFPLLFLIFMVPIPSALMDGFIYFLQVGSTEFTHLLFMTTGVPFFREGFVYHLPGMSIEVAKECSGIRSSLALLITAVLAGHLFLKTRWKKVILVLLVIPVTMFKNGIRILVLTLLGTYVDPRWLTGSSLHRDGGILFFILALLLLAPILYGLRKGDVHK